MRDLATLGFVAVLSAAVACVVQSPPPEEANSSQAEADPCGAACQHYLGCKGIDDEAQWSSCTQQCQASDLDRAMVAQYPSMDCASAIQAVEGDGQAQGGEGGAPGGGGCTADCTGCVWDGSQCYHHAMSMMGSTIACDACCCAEGGSAQRWD